MEPRGARAPRVPGPRRHRGWPLSLVGCAVSVLVGLPAALLRLRSATGHRAGAARVRRATGSATVPLVLLPERQGVLPERADVRRGVDPGPAKASVDGRPYHASSLASGVVPLRHASGARRGLRLDSPQPSPTEVFMRLFGLVVTLCNATTVSTDSFARSSAGLAAGEPCDVARVIGLRTPTLACTDSYGKQTIPGVFSSLRRGPRSQGARNALPRRRARRSEARAGAGPRTTRRSRTLRSAAIWAWERKCPVTHRAMLPCARYPLGWRVSGRPW